MVSWWVCCVARVKAKMLRVAEHGRGKVTIATLRIVKTAVALCLENFAKWGQTMNVKELTNCVEVLGQVAINFADMPTERESAVKAGIACVIAQSIIVKFAAYLAAGVEPYEAMEATARAAFKLPEPDASGFGLLPARPKS